MVTTPEHLEDDAVEVDDDEAGRASPRRPRRASLLLLVPVALLGLALLLRPEQLVSTLSSPRAWLLGIGTVALSLGLRRLAAGLRRPVADLVAVAPLVVAVLLLVVPTLRTTSVQEDLAGLPPVSPEEPIGAAAPAAADGLPVRVASGTVEGIGHRGSGSASLVQLPDGGLVIRFEDLEVDPGPDYRVHVVPGAGAEEPGDGTGLGRLKATSGDQNYPLPADVTTQRPFTVLIWCEAFSVPIAAASIA